MLTRWTAIYTRGVDSSPSDPDGYLVVHDATGREHHVPLRPDGAYLQALERRGAQRDAARPLQELFDELTVATGDLAELERAFAHRRR